MWEAASAFPDSSHTSLEQMQTQVSWLQIQCTSPNHFCPPASFTYCSASIRKHPGASCYWLALEMAGNKQAGFFPLSEPLYPSHHAPFSAVRRKARCLFQSHHTHSTLGTSLCKSVAHGDAFWVCCVFRKHPQNSI